MRKLALLLPLVVAAIIVGAMLHTPQADAEDVIARALDASTNATSTRLGSFTWIEDCGIGIQLPPAPEGDGSFPRLLAGKRIDDSRSSALWELGPDGFGALKTKLEADGATLGGSEPWPFRPRRFPDEVSAQRSMITLPAGKNGIVLDWEVFGRFYALVVEDSSQSQASIRMDELRRELVILPGVAPGAIAPLFFEGRYACVLKDWKRNGERLHRKTGQGWLSLRVFQVDLADFESVGRLQFELEAKLDSAGFKRSAGMKPLIAGSEGFIGEYYSNDGFVQRIAYARLDGAYMVALMQAPETARSTLASEMDSFAGTLTLTTIGNPIGGRSMLFSSVVRNIRCIAWQDGRRVLWGVLFDDGRQQPVMWRQDGIVWNMQMTQRRQMVKERQGTVNSSRALNPLVDADVRELQLPEDVTGEVELALTVGGERTVTRLTIK